MPFNKKLGIVTLIICLFLSNCSNLKTIKDYYAPNNQKITNDQRSRLINYLNGEFYSYELQRNVFAFPLSFLISESGDKSVILACDGIDDNCNDHVQTFQIIQKFKKKGVNLKILATKKRVVIQNKSLQEPLNKIKFLKIKKNSSKFYDKILVPSDSCSDDDC